MSDGVARADPQRRGAAGVDHQPADTVLVVSGGSGYLAALLMKYPQGARARFIRPEEVAELAYFLCTPAAAAITGADLAIDQGYSAGK